MSRFTTTKEREELDARIEFMKIIGKILSGEKKLKISPTNTVTGLQTIEYGFILEIVDGRQNN